RGDDLVVDRAGGVHRGGRAQLRAGLVCGVEHIAEQVGGVVVALVQLLGQPAQGAGLVVGLAPGHRIEPVCDDGAGVFRRGRSFGQPEPTAGFGGQLAQRACRGAHRYSLPFVPARRSRRYSCSDSAEASTPSASDSTRANTARWREITRSRVAVDRPAASASARSFSSRLPAFFSFGLASLIPHSESFSPDWPALASSSASSSAIASARSIAS